MRKVFVQGTDKQTRAFQPQKKDVSHPSHVAEAYKINGMKRVNRN